MAEGGKPYRLYRGGRVKGKVPLRRPATAPPPAPAPRVRRPRRLGRLLALGALALLALALVWAVLGYLSFARGVADANARLPDAAKARLAEPEGSLLSAPATILVVGTDGGRAPARRGARRADSLLLVRTDPGRSRLAYLSIPRDLRVEIPGYGSGKINAANQLGGPALTIAAVRRLTGLPVQHVVVVDFDGFRKLIDALGGIDVDVPRPVLSNRFDCPYPRARCAAWEGWRFEKGRQHMDGRRALVYARIRTNRLDPADTDVSRGDRQQLVAAAVGEKIASLGTFLRLPFVGDELAAPLATDLSAWELVQLAWVRLRAGSSLHCRLGGEPASIGGESVLLGSEDNLDVLSMFLGRSAPVPPPRGTPYGAGCRRG
ncbi:MAG TPA: LCP family protein [Thermodesulfobacteriota bacterium]|nr:LCP family protein [Thermodesulfobacteriota bacterium]